VIGVLQTGSVLHIQDKHVTKEVRHVVETLSEVTGKRFGDDVRAWVRWYAASRRHKHKH